MKKPDAIPKLLRHAADLVGGGETLSGKFEVLTPNGQWELYVGDCLPDFYHGRQWRIADQEPSTFEMKVGDEVFVLNKPYMSAPKNGAEYWCIGTQGYVHSFLWFDESFYERLLKSYNCWKTEADAKAYVEAKLARDKFEIGEIK
jgi:hypothetical protein